MAGLPGLLFHVTGTTGGTRYQSRLVAAFTGTTEYFVNCQYTPAKAVEVEQACNQVVGSFRVGKASATQARPGTVARQQAQSDLTALQGDSFTSDLSTLTSDVHQVGADMAATKSDAALGTDCFNVSTVKIDASTAGIDASNVPLDLQTLTGDIGTATHDIATLKNDLANLSASGLP